MATGYSSADRLRDVDYTRSHRSPPPIPLSPTLRSPPPPTSPARNQREAFSAAVATAIGTRSEARPHDPPRPLGRVNASDISKPAAWPIPDEDAIDSRPPSSRGTVVGGARSRAASTSASASASASASSEGGAHRPRGSSFSFLKRTNTNSSRKASLDQPERTFYTAEPSAPPLPTPTAQQEPDHTPNQSKTSGNMLRKVSGMGGSRRKHEEQERLKKEAAAAAALPRQPPHLPTLSPLPGMSPFSEDRPDSVAIFNHSYTTSTTSPPPPPSRPTANFSRPSQQAMLHNNSPSPGYSSGRADSGLTGSSPPMQYAKVNGVHSSGEYVATDALPDSMTNRGRFSYASSATNVNSFNSPRRIRRKKDPTPFK